MKAILIGRHTGEVPGFEVIEARAVTFPVTAHECAEVLIVLVAEAAKQDAVVLLQNTPGQVAAACVMLARHREPVRSDRHRLGVIVSVPGPRPGKVVQVFDIDADQAAFEADGLATAAMGSVEAAIRLANPRADVTWTEPGSVQVTVDGPPMPFQFSHVEWLD